MKKKIIIAVILVAILGFISFEAYEIHKLNARATIAEANWKTVTNWGTDFPHAVLGVLNTAIANQQANTPKK